MELRRPLFPILLLGALGLTGCAGNSYRSLYIPPSDSESRTLALPSEAVIRMPLVVKMPSLAKIPKDLGQWLNDRLQQIGQAARQPEKLIALKDPTEGIRRSWELMQEPIYIDKDLWLLIRPERISTGLSHSENINPLLWNVELEMTAKPVLIFGPKPAVDIKALPPLRPYQSGPEGFHALSDTFVGFGEANRILADPKSGLVNYRVPGTGGYRLRIKGVKLYGSGGQVIAETRIEYYPLINFEGKPSRMTIYFRGTPVFDPALKEFRLRHLDYDVKTGDVLVQVASWILKSDILESLRKKARIPVGSKLDQIKARMNVVLNCPVGEHSRLVTHVDSFRMLDAFVDREGIQARMSLDGTCQLDLLSR